MFLQGLFQLLLELVGLGLETHSLALDLLDAQGKVPEDLLGLDMDHRRHLVQEESDLQALSLATQHLPQDSLLETQVLEVLLVLGPPLGHTLMVGNRTKLDKSQQMRRKEEI